MAETKAARRAAAMADMKMRLAAYLAGLCDDEWRSAEAVAAECGYSESSTRIALTQMVDSAAVEVMIRSYPGTARTIEQQFGYRLAAVDRKLDTTMPAWLQPSTIRVVGRRRVVRGAASIREACPAQGSRAHPGEGRRTPAQSTAESRRTRRER